VGLGEDEEEREIMVVQSAAVGIDRSYYVSASLDYFHHTLHVSMWWTLLTLLRLLYSFQVVFPSLH